MLSISKNKQTILFIVLAGLFITNAILAEFIGVKIFSLEKSLGFTPLNFSLLGIENLAFNLTAGVLLWPVVFILTDIINEYFGPRGVRFLSYLASALIVYAFIVVFLRSDFNQQIFGQHHILLVITHHLDPKLVILIQLIGLFLVKVYGSS